MRKTLYLLLASALLSVNVGAQTLAEANDLLNRQEYDAASAAYEKIGEMDQAKQEGWRLNNWALCYLRTNKPAKAIPLLEKSVKVFDANSTAWNNLGTAYERTGDRVKALEIYKNAVKVIRVQLKEYWKGIEAKPEAASKTIDATGMIEEATGLQPDDVKDKLNEAKILLNDGKYRESSAIYSGIGKTRSETREGWKFNNWGLCFLSMAEESDVGASKNLHEALTRFKKSVEALPSNSVAWNNLGVTYEKLGGFRQAAEAYGKSVKAAKDEDKDWLRAELNQVKVEFLIEKSNAEIERQ